MASVGAGSQSEGTAPYLGIPSPTSSLARRRVMAFPAPMPVPEPSSVATLLSGILARRGPSSKSNQGAWVGHGGHGEPPPNRVVATEDMASLWVHTLDVPTHEPQPPSPLILPVLAHMQPLFEAYYGGTWAPLVALLMKLAVTHRRIVVLHDHRSQILERERARRSPCWRRESRVRCFGRPLTSRAEEASKAEPRGRWESSAS